MSSRLSIVRLNTFGGVGTVCQRYSHIFLKATKCSYVQGWILYLKRVMTSSVWPFVMA